MIDIALASESVQQAMNSIESRRRYFVGDYIGEKHTYFGTSNLFQIDGLAADLKDAAREYDTDIATYFDNSEGTNLNILRAFLSFDFLAYAMMESLAVWQEAYILESYGFPDTSCEYIADTLMSLDSKAVVARQRLLDVQGLIIHQREDKDCCGEDKVTVMGGTVHAPSSLGSLSKFTDRGIHVFTEKNAYSGNDIDRIKAERVNDITNLSYPIADFVEYTNTFRGFSIDMCRAVRTDLEVRTRFETDDISLGAVCKDAFGSCLSDIDCCSGDCEGNICLN